MRSHSYAYRYWPVRLSSARTEGDWGPANIGVDLISVLVGAVRLNKSDTASRTLILRMVSNWQTESLRPTVYRQECGRKSSGVENLESNSHPWTHSMHLSPVGYQLQLTLQRCHQRHSKTFDLHWDQP